MDNNLVIVGYMVYNIVHVGKFFNYYEWAVPSHIKLSGLDTHDLHENVIVFLERAFLY